MNVKTVEQNNQKENFKIHMGKKGKRKKEKKETSIINDHHEGIKS